ncbi:hypothetical protein [Leptotrichia alba]|uniref:SH3b domain-containing protein n=1 Tax=Leptotrichia alba TaxID=3239304 RepID=A0AB39V685_9FUSO
MKKVLLLIMLIITCVSFGKNDNGDNITTEAKGMLRFVWMDHGKYNKYSKFPITGIENSGTAGFAIYLEFTPEDKGKFMNHILTVWPGDIYGKVNGKEMHNRILSIGKEISPDIENKMKKNDWGYVSQPVKLTLKPVKLYGNCCSISFYYAEVVKYEKIPSTTVKIPLIKDEVESGDRIAYDDYNPYTIYSKEGLSNIRKGPSKKYDVIDKIENGSYAVITQDFGEWKYVNYFFGGADESKYGFVHKSQLKISK